MSKRKIEVATLTKPFWFSTSGQVVAKAMHEDKYEAMDSLIHLKTELLRAKVDSRSPLDAEVIQKAMRHVTAAMNSLNKACDLFKKEGF